MTQCKEFMKSSGVEISTGYGAVRAQYNSLLIHQENFTGQRPAPACLDLLKTLSSEQSNDDRVKFNREP